jgi:hypothetical protein
MSIPTFPLGTLVRLSAPFVAGGVAIDPATVTLAIKTPAGVTTTYTYGVDSGLLKDGVGLYHLDVAASASGTWFWNWSSTGVGQAAMHGQFMVEGPRT